MGLISTFLAVGGETILVPSGEIGLIFTGDLIFLTIGVLNLVIGKGIVVAAFLIGMVSTLRIRGAGVKSSREVGLLDVLRLEESSIGLSSGSRARSCCWGAIAHRG